MLSPGTAGRDILIPMKLLAFASLLSVAALRAFAQPVEVSSSINLFGLDLLRAQAAATPTDNLLLSPYSIESALTMAWTGADGVTREEMRRVLHLGPDDEAVVNGFNALNNTLSELQAASSQRAETGRQHGGKMTPIELNVANRLFVQSGFALLPDFTRTLRERFGAPLDELDFLNAPESARLTINDWVAHKTHDRITDLIPSGALDANTRLVLANAIYLKAPWMNSFKTSATRPEPFFVGGTTGTMLPMMQQRKSCAYKTLDGFIALALPYDGGDLQFLILLPDQRDGLAELERTVTPAMLAACTNLPSTDLILHLPKFKLAPPSMSLGLRLRGLGMTTAFDQPRGSANFARMAPRRPDDYLCVSDVIHKTWISVDEDGTEAAASTAVIMMRALGVFAPDRRPVPEIRVDHPFLFAIQHVASGTCLFLGRVEDPR